MRFAECFGAEFTRVSVNLQVDDFLVPMTSRPMTEDALAVPTLGNRGRHSLQ